MQDNEQRAYLRNLLIVVRADEVIAPQENQLLERILAEHDLPWALLEVVHHELHSEGEKPHIDLQPIVRFSTRVRCLEDMLELSLADGHMGQAEKALLFGAAQRVGIGQAQVAELIEEARRRQG